MNDLGERIRGLAAKPPAEGYTPEDHALFEEFRAALGEGRVRAAVREEGSWTVNVWVKEGILLGFRMGTLRSYSGGEVFRFFDKHTFPPKRLTPEHGVRAVPGGSAIREGAYVAPGVICMPPMYVNVGAYVDEGTMIDSHVLVGSCAQVGRRVHLSAGSQVGGVLEPAGALPVIIEDDVLVGGNCGIYEGALVREGAVLGAGVILTGGTPVYDLAHQVIYRRKDGGPLEIPPRAVVVAGCRAISRPWAREMGLSIYTPIIIKYRDSKTDASAQLEELLR